MTVRTHDGREVDTVVEHSIVTPDDRGEPIEFREVCYRKGNSDCRYGRPVPGVWALAVTILGMVRITLNLLMIIGVGFYLVRAVVGVPRYYAWLRRREARKPVSPAEERLRRLTGGGANPD